MFPIIAAGVALAGGIFAAYASKNSSHSSGSSQARSTQKPLAPQSFIVTPIPRDAKPTEQASLVDSVRNFLF